MAEYTLKNRKLRVDTATGAAAISLSTDALTNAAKLNSVLLKMSTAPTTSQAFTITYNSKSGSAYDVVLLTNDLSVESVTSLFWQPDQDLWLAPGDSIDLAYTNTDTKTYGATITLLEEV